MKDFWEHIEPILISITAINFVVFWSIMVLYTSASYRLSAMTDKIKKDGNLENFKVPITKYLFNLKTIEDLTLKIPSDNNYQKFQAYKNLTDKVKRQRKLIKWAGIPLLIFVGIIFTAMAFGLV